jgi:hypothetical protein
LGINLVRYCIERKSIRQTIIGVVVVVLVVPITRMRIAGNKMKLLELQNTMMKPMTIAIIGALIVAVAVLGYLYYQRTSGDITVQLPKVELKP